MSVAEDNRRRFTQMYLDAYRGDFDLTREILSNDFVCRNPLQPAGGTEDVIRMLQAQIDAFENIRFVVQYSFASETGFGIAYEISGRHVKPVFGIPPTGKAFTVKGVSIHEIADGRSIGVHSSANFIEVLGAPSEAARAS